MQRSEPNRWQDDKYVRTVQYANSNRLSARANIHAKYGRGDWFSWLASQPDWPWDGGVLEVGCGAGWFWAEAASQLPARLRIQLTDVSLGMVTEALKRVRATAHWNQVEGRVADASALPFPGGSFDAVLASHMLYHLPDPRDGVTEIARVLRSNGTAVIATNGISNMRELLDLRRSVFGGDHGDQVSSAFTLENGRPMLEAVFATVELRRYPDLLVCTDPRDIIDYLTSSPPGDGAPEHQIEALSEAVTTAFDKIGGKFTVTKDVGVFLCRGATYIRRTVGYAYKQTRAAFFNSKGSRRSTGDGHDSRAVAERMPGSFAQGRVGPANRLRETAGIGAELPLFRGSMNAQNCP